VHPAPARDPRSAVGETLLRQKAHHHDGVVIDDPIGVRRPDVNLCIGRERRRIDTRGRRPAQRRRRPALPERLRLGYGDSGPAQLALTILLRATDRETAVAHHQAFKWDLMIAKLPQADFSLHLAKVRDWLAARN